MTQTRSIQFALWILAIYALGTLACEASTLFLWIVVSFMVFALLDKPAQMLKAKGVSTMVASLGLVLAATFIVAVIVLLLGHFSSDMISELENSKKIFINYYNQLEHQWNALSNIISHSVNQASPPQQTPADVQKVQMVQASPFGGEVGTTLIHSLGSAVTMIVYITLCPILAFFLLAERDSLAKVFARLFPDGDQERGRKMWDKIVAANRAYFLGNLVLGLVTYPIFVALFMFFHVPGAWSLAVLSSVFNLVPFLGAAMSGFLPSLTLLGTGDHVVASLVLYAICVAVHFSVANFVTPKMLGSKVDINATTSTIAMIALGELWGGMGLILAIPLIAIMKIIFQYSGSDWLQWFAALMAENVDSAFEPKVEREAVANQEASLPGLK